MSDMLILIKNLLGSMKEMKKALSSGEYEKALYIQEECQRTMAEIQKIDDKYSSPFKDGKDCLSHRKKSPILTKYLSEALILNKELMKDVLLRMEEAANKIEQVEKAKRFHFTLSHQHQGNNLNLSI